MRPTTLLILAGLAGLVVLPFVITSPYYVHLVVTIAIYSIVTLGLDIVFGYTGEVSIGHAAFLGIGAYTAGCVLTLFGIGFWPALIAGPIVAAGFGVLLALPALRVTGPYLAMVTLAFGTIVQILINEGVDLTNGAMGIKLTLPLFVDWRDWSDWLPFLDMSAKRMKETEFYYVTAIALVGVIVVVNRLVASHIGRAFEALRDSPIACDCMGVSVYRYKVTAFVASATFAGLAGVLFAYSEQYIAPNNFSFDLSIQFLLAVTLGGRKSRLGPILGAAIVVFLPNLLADISLFRWLAGFIAALALVVGATTLIRRPADFRGIAVPVFLCFGFFAFAVLLDRVTDYKLSIFGVMILFVVFYLPDGIVGYLKSLVARIRPQWMPKPEAIATGADSAAAWRRVGAPAPDSAASLLAVDQIVMQFGGLRALDHVTIDVAPGTIHGLIGPNGSGKSTMMNVLTGIYTPTAGSIRFRDGEIAGLKSPVIALRGIARTFQNVQLFGELTLLENVLVGLHHTYRSGVFAVALGLGQARRDEASARIRAAAILSFIGLADLAHEEARNLPYGKQRLLEIGRALALDPELLLLDEPAAGLTAPDIAVLIEIIRKIRDHGITLILIEHHMDVVMGLCDRVTVLDFGQKIAEGLPAQVRADDRVIEAYLGGAAA